MNARAMKVLKGGANVVSVLSVVAIVVSVGQRLIGHAVPEKAAATVAAGAGPGVGAPGPPVGATLDLPMAPTATGTRVLVVALDVGCAWNGAMIEFYRHILKSEMPNVAVVAVLPQSLPDSQAYLASMDLPVSEVVRLPLSAIRVRQWPTLLLLDDHRRVLNVWAGVLPREDKRRVEMELGLAPSKPGGENQPSGDDAALLNVAAVSALLSNRNALILDVRPRRQFTAAHLPDALNIPVDELAVRAVHEVAPERPTLIYCRDRGGADGQLVRSMCTAAYHELSTIGFEHLYATSEPLHALSEGIAMERASTTRQP